MNKNTRQPNSNPLTVLDVNAALKAIVALPFFAEVELRGYKKHQKLKLMVEKRQ